MADVQGSLLALRKACIWGSESGGWVGEGPGGGLHFQAHSKLAWTAGLPVAQMPSYSRFFLSIKMQGPKNWFVKLLGVENTALKTE